MTFTQISYFLEVAKTLSFTEAAKRLFITQPTLSRQITSIESELNMQLFVRTPKSLKLTPSGVILYEEWSRIMEENQRVLERAEQAGRGMSKTLQIGVLDGHSVAEILPDAIEYFEKNYANIKIYLRRFSYKRLVEQLYDRELDAILTYRFDVEDKPDLQYMEVQEVQPVIVYPSRSPLAQKTSLTFRDFQNESFVIVNEQECPSGVHLVIDACREYGGFYPNFYFVDTMEDAILWVEAGVRCALFNTGMNIMNSKKVKIAPLPRLPSMATVLAWHKGNENETLPLLVNYFQSDRSSTNG